MFVPWNIYIIYCNHGSFQENPHDKICICFDDGSDPLFFFVNTNKQFDFDQLELAISELPENVLTHTSYLDFSSAKQIPKNLLKNDRDRGQTPKDLRDRIEPALRLAEVLPARHIKRAVQTLDHLK